MSKKKITYTGDIEDIIGNHIYINIKNLNQGKYTLNIVYKNRIIKQVNFKK
jgi:hypothetical protein